MKYINNDQWNELLTKLADQIIEEKKYEFKSKPNKGVQFELLIERLLELMFENSHIVFNSTQMTYDGSKDFWAMDDKDDVWWAECKNYSSSISLKHLAPTLIMAEINNVQYLIFFSFTKINKNLKRRIGQYAYEHNKEIYLYDDETLEALLFVYKNSFMVNLEDYIKPSRISFDNYTEIYFFNEYNAQSLNRRNFYGYYKIEELQVGGIYDLNTLVINRHLKENCMVTLSVDDSIEDRYYFDILLNKGQKNNSVITFELKPNQIRLSKISVRVIKYKENLCLPQIKVKIKYSSSNEAEKHSPLDFYSCLWTRKSILIGKEYEKILIDLKNKCLRSNYVSGILIYGSGGTGKTRILEECYAILIEKEYKVLNFIGFERNSSWKDVIREITYTLFEISEDISLDIVCNMTEIVNPNIEESEKREIYNFLKLLSSEVDDDALFEEYYRIIFKKLQEQNYAIIIDNLQSYHPKILVFFTKMIQFFCSNQKKCSLTLLFVINTSLVFDNEFLDFIGDFEIISGTSLKTNFLSYPLNGFHNENNAIAFLKTILKLEEYPLNFFSLKQILQKTSLKPKYIELVSDYLLQLDCIEIINERGVVKKPLQLQKELHNIPDKYEKLFGKMYRAIVKESPNGEKEFKDFISLLYLFDELNDRLIDSLELNRSIPYVLYKHNIIKDTDFTQRHCYSFEHDLIEICLSKEIYTDILEHSLNYIKRYQLLFQTILKDKKSQYILYQLYNKMLSSDQIIKINNNCHNINFSNKLLYKFYEYLIQNLICYKNEYDDITFISELLKCCNYVRDHISEKQAEELYDQSFPHINDIPLVSVDIIRKWFSFIIHYCENKNRLQKSEESLKTYNVFLFQISQLKQVFPDAKVRLSYAESYIQNRIFVCGKIEGDTMKYMEQLKASMRVANKLKFYDILFENYFDAANIYFQGNRNSNKGISLLKKGLQAFEKMPSITQEKFIVNYYSKKILYYLLEIKLDAAENTINSALEELQRNKYINYHIFFKGKYLRFKIICLLLKKTQGNALKNAFEEYEKYLQIIQSSEDFDWYFLQAKYAFFLKKGSVFQTMFNQCYSLLGTIEKLKPDNSKERIMIDDLSIMYRLLYPDIENYNFLNLEAEILNNANYILTITHEEFVIYESHYKSSAPITDLEQKDGYFP